MSREDVEVSSNTDAVRRLITAFNERDIEAVVRAVHPQGEIHSLRSAIEGPYLGHIGVRRWAAGFREFGDDYSIEVNELREAGDAVVVLGRQRATSAHGLPLDEPLAGIVVFDDGLIRRVQIFHTAQEALEAAGLRE